MNYRNYKKERDAYPFRVGFNKAKSITSFGVRRFGTDLRNGISFIIYLIVKLVNKICVGGVIIFGLLTIFNVFSMGISFDLFQTKSFFLLVGSLIIGGISYVIEGMIG